MPFRRIGILVASDTVKERVSARDEIFDRVSRKAEWGWPDNCGFYANESVGFASLPWPASKDA